MVFSKLSVATATLALCRLGLAKDGPATTTVDLLQWLGIDGRLAGSVVTAAPSATTYHLNCLAPEGAKDEEDDYGCGTITIVQGPATHSMHVEWDPFFTKDMACDLTGSTRAACTGSATSLNEFVGKTGAIVSMSETATLTDDSLPWFRVPITAGAEKLVASETGTGTATATATATTTTATSSSDSEADSTQTGTPAASQPSGTSGADLIGPQLGVGVAMAAAAAAAVF